MKQASDTDKPPAGTAAATAPLRVQTLGGFRLWREGTEVERSDWGREKALHLFQFLLTLRRRPLHKEEIIDRLWPELDANTGDRDFKVALNAVNKALEPDRPPRTEPTYVQRLDLTYGLRREALQVDADVFTGHVTAGNEQLRTDRTAAVAAYREAVAVYTGDFLPERRYEDWASAERERLKTLALGTMTHLARLVLHDNPLESLQLAQRALRLDPVWEDAYRVQMRAHLATGNRPLALRTYQQCVEVLAREFGVEPLPETQAVYEEMRRGGGGG